MKSYFLILILISASVARADNNGEVVSQGLPSNDIICSSEANITKICENIKQEICSDESGKNSNNYYCQLNTRSVALSLVDGKPPSEGQQNMIFMKVEGEFKNQIEKLKGKCGNSFANTKLRVSQGLKTNEYAQYDQTSNTVKIQEWVFFNATSEQIEGIISRQLSSSCLQSKGLSESFVENKDLAGKAGDSDDKTNGEKCLKIGQQLDKELKEIEGDGDKSCRENLYSDSNFSCVELNKLKFAAYRNLSVINNKTKVSQLTELCLSTKDHNETNIKTLDCYVKSSRLKERFCPVKKSPDQRREPTSVPKLEGYR